MSTDRGARLRKPTDIEAAQAKAAHEAMELFFNVLKEELAKISGSPTILQALGRTAHVHFALIDEGGGMKGVVRYAFQFDDAPEAIREAVAMAGRGIG